VGGDRSTVGARSRIWMLSRVGKGCGEPERSDEGVDKGEGKSVKPEIGGGEPLDLVAANP
jgi:hypothetical protein